MMRRAPPITEKGRKFSLDMECSMGQPEASTASGEYEAPIWGAFRQKIFSFVRSRSRSPNNKSPGSKSPGNRSPTGLKSPFSTSPSNKSPMNRSPSSKSPANRSPSVRSPTNVSPSRGSPCGTPPLRSPPPAAASVRRSSFSKVSRESRSSSGEAELLYVNTRRGSVATNHGMKKGLGLTLKRENNDSCDSSSGTPGTGSPGTPIGIKKAKIKLKGSPGDFMDLQKMDDDLRFAEAALRPRKWSYHGTASPSTPVEAPKRHSFSTASGHKSGIVVSNNDLAKLLGQNRLLLPGLPLCDLGPLPVLPNPKARGRSQSIAVCAQSISKIKSGKSSKNEPIAPVLIRTTDCDHMASIQAHDSVDSQKDDEDDDDPEKLLWDSSGSTVNINLLGSVIEQYLQTAREDDDYSDEETNDNEEEIGEPQKRIENNEGKSLDPDTDPMEPSGGLTQSFKGLQVK